MAGSTAMPSAQPAGRKSRPNRILTVLVAALAYVAPGVGPAVIEGSALAGGALAAEEAATAAFMADTVATSSLSNLPVIALTVVGVILAAVVGLLVLNLTTPMYFGALTGFIGTLSAISFGSTFGDGIRDIIVLIVEIVAPFSFLALALLVIVVRKHKGTS